MNYRWLLALLCLMVLGLVACGDEATAPRRPTPYTPPALIPWQRPAAPITLQNVAQVQLLGLLDGHTDSIFESAISPNSQRLVTIGGDNRLLVWNMASGRSLMSLDETLFSYAFFLPTEETLLTLNAAQNLQKWAILGADLLGETVATNYAVPAALLSPAGDKVVIGDLDGQISVFDTATLELITRFAAHVAGNPVRSLYYSADASRLYSIGQDGRTYQWDAATWERLGTLEEQGSAPLGSAVSPDRQLLAIVRSETVTIFDTNTGSLQATFTLPPFQGVQQIAFSEDKAWLAVGGDIDSVVIYDVESGELVVALRGHGRNFRALAFAPDRSMIVTGISGGQAILWNLSELPTTTSQAEIQIQQSVLDQVPDLQLSQLRWSPDGTYLVLGDRRGTVFILGVPG